MTKPSKKKKKKKAIKKPRPTIVRGWRTGAAKNASKRAWKKRCEQICKCCGISLKGVPPIKPFSEVYMRLCPVRDGDMCERIVRT